VTVQDLVEKFGLQTAAAEKGLDRSVKSGYCGDLMSDILAGLSEGCVLLTGLTTVQAVRTAVVAGVAAIVFVRDKTPPQAVIDLARTEGIPLLTTPFSMFISCGRLHANGITGLNGMR
jgi:serine kinase of HPr protein (carbohydrate metabolism regulator)